MEFFTTGIGIITGIAGIAGATAVGVLYFTGVFKGKKDEAANNLINILQETVGELEKKVDKQRVDIDELTTEVEELRRDNKRYIEILQGRDAQTQKFYEAAFDSMKVAKETHALVMQMAASSANTNESINKMIDLLSKHTDVVDHAIKK